MDEKIKDEEVLLVKAPKDEIQQSILQDELDSVENNLEELRQQGHSISRVMEKGLVKRQMNLEPKPRQ